VIEGGPQSGESSTKWLATDCDALAALDGEFPSRELLMHVDSRDWFTVTHDMPQFAMKLRTWVTRLHQLSFFGDTRIQFV
jgi:hypothetical protein